MNDYNHYYFKEHNEDKINRVLRFYQSTVSINELIESRNDNIPNINVNFNIPDLFISKIPFFEITNNIRIIIEEIRKFEVFKKRAYFFPILIIKNMVNMDSGIYCIDYNNEDIIKYKEIDYESYGMNCLNDSFDLGISYFLEVDRAVIDKGESGFIEGILQIGQIMERVSMIASNNNFKIYNMPVPKQAFTHGLGLNCKSMLYICNQLMEKDI